ncbi:MAG TPA: hypothetical protein PLD88_10075 [Candidatus Berkiella sp.]|nr:hypothetical protein [Candidatus Berkiella sp.]
MMCLLQLNVTGKIDGTFANQFIEDIQLANALGQWIDVMSWLEQHNIQLSPESIDIFKQILHENYQQRSDIDMLILYLCEKLKTDPTTSSNLKAEIAEIELNIRFAKINMSPMIAIVAGSETKELVDPIIFRPALNFQYGNMLNNRAERLQHSASANPRMLRKGFHHKRVM